MCCDDIGIEAWRSYPLFFQVNPFSDRMCDVFSSSLNGNLSFEDFLEMMSAFSEKANRNVKIDYVFKIYGKPAGSSCALSLGSFLT